MQYAWKTLGKYVYGSSENLYASSENNNLYNMQSGQI